MNLTPEQLEERIPILRAACAGKVVQIEYKGTWRDIAPHEIAASEVLNPTLKLRIKPPVIVTSAPPRAARGTWQAGEPTRKESKP